MKTGRTIVKNFGSLVTADFIVKVVGFSVTIFLARKFSPHDFGVLNFSLSIVNYFAFLADPGVSTYGVKKVSREPDRIPEHINDISLVRVCLAAATFLMVAAIVAALGQPPLVKTLILVYALTILPQAVNLTWVYQGLQKMEFTGLYSVIQSLVYAGLIFILIKGSKDIVLIPIFLTAAYVIPAAWLILRTVKIYGYRFRKIAAEEGLAVIKESLPIGVGYFLICGVNWNLSTSLLGFLSDQAQVGYFSIAFKVALVVMGGGVAFSAALFPAFSKYLSSSRDTAEKILRSAEKITLIVAWPLIAGTIAISGALIPYVFGSKYADSGMLLKALMAGSVLYVLNNIYNVYLIADEKHVRNMNISVFRTGLLAALSLTLIPYYGASGAAAGYALSEFLTLLVYLRVVGGGAAARVMGFSFKPLIASSGMYFVIFYLNGANLAVKTAAGVISYAILILAVKGVRIGEIKKFRGYMAGKPE